MGQNLTSPVDVSVPVRLPRMGNDQAVHSEAASLWDLIPLASISLSRAVDAGLLTLMVDMLVQLQSKLPLLRHLSPRRTLRSYLLVYGAGYIHRM
jgi:hypothetical protein